MEVGIAEILAYLDNQNIKYKFLGDVSDKINGFSSFSNYKKGTMTWLKTESICHQKQEKEIFLCVVQEGITVNLRNQIICPNSKEVFFKIIEQFFSGKEKREGIGKNTVVGNNVQIGCNVYIGNNCSIEGEIKIGDNTIISDNVVIKNKVYIGKNCEIQSLSVIGEDGFGYYEDDSHNKIKVRHHGGVVIGDNVFVGSHVNIARGVIDDTVIKDGVKVAPSTHIGHNNYIEKNATIICSQLYGSVRIGENAYIVGSIVRNQCTIGKNSMIGMGSVVTKDIGENKMAMGVPARVIREI